MSFFFYLAQVSLYGLIMWGIYCAVWQNKAIHSGSRFYLLLSAVLPLVLPLIQISTNTISLKGIQRVLLPDALVSPDGSIIQATDFQTGSSTALSLYFVVSLAIACIYLSAYRMLYAKLKQGVALKYQQYTVIMDAGIGPGTIGRRIFFAGQEVDNLIIQHELAHIKAGHRFDIAFIQLLRIVFWASPAVWLIGRELKTVHEFEADAAAAGITDVATNLFR